MMNFPALMILRLAARLSAARRRRSVPPRLRGSAGIDSIHSDRAGRRTDEVTKVTAHALRFDDTRVSLAVDLFELETLMRSILTCDIAKIAPDTIIFVDVG